MNLDPEAFIREQGWMVKRQGQELVTHCPLCDKPNHLYINQESGAWKCHRCGESGNLYQLKRRLHLPTEDRWAGVYSMREALKPTPAKRIPMEHVDKLHMALMADTEALAYCSETRKWTREVLVQHKIGLRHDHRGKWLAYPWITQGQCKGIKYRVLPAYHEQGGSRFDREVGCESVLYNFDALALHRDAILTSGESDALTLLSLGFSNVVGSTTGESSLPLTAVDALAKKEAVYIAYDNDEAGRNGARDVGRRIGYERAWFVPLPTGKKDLSEIVASGGDREDIEVCLAQMVRFDIPSVCSVPQALDRLAEDHLTRATDTMAAVTPWHTVNRRIKRWRPGNVIYLGAPQGTGKTTWALNVAAHWAGQQCPVLMYCLEMHISELIQHVLCAHYQRDEEQVNAEVIGQARRDLVQWPLYLGANPRVTKPKDLFELLRQAIRRYGLRLLIFDNIHALARNIEHRTEEVSALSKQFKSLAMEMEIPILVIAQPRKLTPGVVMTPWDFKDSVDLYSDADQMIILHRETLGRAKDHQAVAEADGEQDTVSPYTLVRIGKARHVAERDVTLYFEGAYHRFREMTTMERMAEAR